MARPQIVIDASVAVKWFNEEEYTEAALNLKTAYRERRIILHTQALLPYELLNALRYNPNWMPKDIAEAARHLQKLSLKYYPLEGSMVDDAIRLSNERKISVYDASYLALGNLLEADVYTSDERMLAKVNNPRLRHIRDFTDPAA